MNILVTGANGQLGNELRLVAAETDAAAGGSFNFIFSDIAPESEESLKMLSKLVGEMPGEAVSVDTATEILDITDAVAVKAFVEERGIGCIINCAAFTNVDAAETNGPLARRLNADAPGILADAMRGTDGLLIHISTDYVLGGEPYNTPCSEERTGTPTGVYGATKLEGERNVLASGCRSVIIRTAWLYSEFGKNFCRTMLSLTAAKPALNVVFDQAGTPTYARDLAEAIMEILKSACARPVQYGIYHFSNEGVCSWYDFTKAIQSIDNDIRSLTGEPQTACRVNPCHSSEFPSPVRRPAYSVLDKTKIKTAFALDIPYWTDSLRRCINNIKL